MLKNAQTKRAAQRGSPFCFRAEPSDVSAVRSVIAFAGNPLSLFLHNREENRKLRMINGASIFHAG